MSYAQSSDLKEEVFETEDYGGDNDTDVKTNVNNDDDITEDADFDEKGGQDSLVDEATEPVKAFQVFGGKIYDPKQPIGKSARVYETTTKNDQKFESPLQKYQRLTREIGEFQQELQSISERASKDQSDPTREITQTLNTEISKLWGNVEEFKSNPQLASLFAEANASVLETVDSKLLFKKLEQFQAESQQNGNNKSNGNNRATFTLYSNGSLNSQSFRGEEIEQRLSNLEKIIGNKNENSSKNMMSSIEYLQKRLDLLADESRLDRLKRNASKLKKDLQAFQTKKSQEIEDQITKTKEDRIDEMFSMMSRWDQSALQLPTIIDRLRSLKNLHEESADVVGKVQHLETQHSLIKQTLESNQKLLNQVSQNLAQNAKTMTDNVQSIEERIARLQQAMGN